MVKKRDPQTNKATVINVGLIPSPVDSGCLFFLSTHQKILNLSYNHEHFLFSTLIFVYI